MEEREEIAINERPFLFDEDAEKKVIKDPRREQNELEMEKVVLAIGGGLKKALSKDLVGEQSKLTLPLDNSLG